MRNNLAEKMVEIANELVPRSLLEQIIRPRSAVSLKQCALSTYIFSLCYHSIQNQSS